MTWPTPQDYNEAIQSPRFNFNDPELKGGSVETTALGLPRPITGGFASVYRVRCSNREWAVRCFLREFTDQQQRYEAISKQLSAAKLPYTVGFDFLPKGIKVSGKWYPILKMEWVQGELLNKYIRKNLKDSAALLNLANQWATMVKSLQVAKIAHGDLQHGNVLVANGELRLIDYDGMYVPALDGHSSHEVGHRNYQHPQRTEFDFGPTVDNFAAWVIYVSLLALSIDPSLWDRAKAGDEYLLFRREDFEEPYTSETLTLLSKHADHRLDTLASFFQSLLYSSPTQLPPLDGQPALQTLSALPQSTTSSGVTKGKPSWLNDYVPSLPPSKIAPTGEITPSENSNWVIDFITSTRVAEQKLLEANVLKPQLILMASAVACGLLVGLHLVFALTLSTTVVFIFTVAMIVGVFLRDLYHRDPVVITMIEAARKEQDEKLHLEMSQRMLKVKEAKKIEIREKEKGEHKAIHSRREAIQDKERREKEQAQALLSKALSAANVRRQSINRSEAVALRKIQDRTGSEVASLNRQIASLVVSEADELSNTLRKLQDQALTSYLISRSIEHATIHGVGEKLKIRLWYAGIRTAADVEYWRVTQVDGIGDSKAIALITWRNHVASFARVPSALSQADVATIKARYSSQKQQLEAQRDGAQRRLNAEVNAVRSQAANEIIVANDELSMAQSKANQEIRAIADQYAPRYDALTKMQSEMSTEANQQCQKLDEEIGLLRKKMGEYHWQLTKIRRELLAYDSVSFKTYLRVVLGVRK